jgi:CheY-like chemotaxis protein
MADRSPADKPLSTQVAVGRTSADNWHAGAADNPRNAVNLGGRASRRVLVVDDQDDMREMARMALHLVGKWEVLTASSGRQALELAATEQLDAILLDMMMPDLDGLTTFGYLQANPATRSIPVILLTADQTQLPMLGATGVIAKPFHPLKLAGQVAAMLGWSP